MGNVTHPLHYYPKTRKQDFTVSKKLRNFINAAKKQKPEQNTFLSEKKKNSNDNFSKHQTWLKQTSHKITI